MNRAAYWSFVVVIGLIGMTACGGGSSLSNTPPPTFSITVASGSSQSTIVSTAFSALLVANVTKNGSPASGMSVTFTAPGSGASGTFANGQASETDQTDANGMATSSRFTANATAGGPYMVAAAVSGAKTPANFSLTNQSVVLTSLSFYLSGEETTHEFIHKNFYALAGSIQLDSNGNVVAGEQDYNDGNGLASPEPQGDSITGGFLALSGSGQGTLTLNTNNKNLGSNGVETFGVQFVNANHALIVEYDGSATSSGSLDLQTLPSTPSGGFAFTLSGIDTGYNGTVSGGVFSISGTALQNGIADTDDNGTITMRKPFTGTMSAPDAFGRGTITGTALAGTLNYYIVGSAVMRLIDVDANDSAIGSAYGQGTASFNAASLGASVFGVEANPFETPFAMAGMFTTSSSGTFTGVADDDENGVVIDVASAIGGSYSVSPTIGGVTYNGYGSLTITPGNLGKVSALGIYLTDPNLNLSDPNNTTSGQGGGLVVDLDSTLGGAGILIPQTDTNPSDVAGNYAFGGQEYNADQLDEFDFVGLGSLNGGAFSGSALVSDPGNFFSKNVTDSGVTFVGTATPDAANVGRFTMPVTVTVTNIAPTDLTIVLYQASSGQLMWLDEDPFSTFVAPMEQQGSLAGVAARKAAANARLKRK